MLKVFLVEDEFIVREGIKKIIDWAGNGYDFCGEASDGERAFPLIQKLKPDIVITDIKMPFMDGLELSRLIKSKLPATEIIILSGYADFEYAKEAIKIGVAEYLSKPVNGEELLREVGIVAKRIEEKKSEEIIKEKYRLEMEENTKARKRKLFNYLVTGNKSMTELYEKAEKVSVDLTAAYYSIMLFKAMSNKKEQSFEFEEFENLMQEISDEISSDNTIVFDRDQEGIAILTKGDSEIKVKDVQADLVDRIISIMKEKGQLDYFGGIGCIVERISELPRSFDTAGHAFSMRYLGKESRFVNCDEIEKTGIRDEVEVDIFNIDTKQIDRGRFTNFLQQGENSETKFFVDEFIKGVGEKAFDSILFRQYIIMDMYFCVIEFIEKLDLDKSVITPPDVAKLSSGDGDELKRYLENIITTVIDMRNEAAGSKYRDVVTRVKSYIDEHYAEDELSLIEIARFVNFSPNHLSTIFAQETGQTFIKYLTDYRINLAKNLLRCTGHKSSEISLMVGYKDPHYFSFLFKKTQGMTPTQYRESKN